MIVTQMEKISHFENTILGYLIYRSILSLGL